MVYVQICLNKNHDQDPLDIVTEFIRSKGLKLYGGLALHKHLKKKGISNL